MPSTRILSVRKSWNRFKGSVQSSISPKCMCTRSLRIKLTTCTGQTTPPPEPRGSVSPPVRYATPLHPGRHPVLPIKGTRLLSPYVHTSAGRMLLSCPGENVQFVRGNIFASQIQPSRPLYINALLIQSRGVVLAQRCTNCLFVPFNLHG